MKKLSIIDGSGFMFRARYAFPPMPNPRHQGKNLNVVYGFIRMMLKLLAEGEKYFVIARDSPIKTKRREQYPDYKANRKKLEDEFSSQIPLVLTLVNELQIPNILAPGYEADDIIATLTQHFCSDPEVSIEIFSSDKDLKQLLQSNVTVTDPLKNLSTTPHEFEKEFWFAPASMLDYLALIGDNADNIKGVSWIGPKKASELIKNYQTIENIYTHLDELNPDLRAKLTQGKDAAFFSKSLISLMEVPDLINYRFDSTQLVIDFQKREKILIQDWGFTSLQKTFDQLKKISTQPQQLGLF